MMNHLHRGWSLRVCRTLAGLLFVCLLAVSLCAWPVQSRAASEIAILNSSDIAAYREAISGFKAKGPGNAVYTEFHLEGDLEKGRMFAQKIRASGASLVLAVGLKAALAAKLDIMDVPVVYMMVLDPAKHRLSAPNMTGTLLEIPVDRQLKTIRTFLPNVRRLGTLYDPKKSASKLKEIEQQTAMSALAIDALPVESERDVPQRLREVLPTADALWLLPDSTVLTNDSVHFLLESALAQHVPVIGFSPEFARLGALLALSVNYGEVGRQTGLLAKRILDGDRVLPLAPMSIDRIKISVNLKTARFLGVAFPKEVESLIDEIF
jgi:putative ABC transport system substrate-binding protein